MMIPTLIRQTQSWNKTNSTLYGMKSDRRKAIPLALSTGDIGKPGMKAGVKFKIKAACSIYFLTISSTASTNVQMLTVKPLT